MRNQDPLPTKMTPKRRKVSHMFLTVFFIRSTHVYCFPVVESKEGIEDRTETNLVNLRRVIYLTIMNALNYEEAVHKLLKIELQEGQEVCTFFLGFVP